MSRDNPYDDEILDLLQRVKTLETAAPVGFTSVSSGSLRILSPEGFYVGGAASAFVDGLLKVLGTLEVTGIFALTGTGTAAGAFTVTGPFTVEGNTSMTGNFTSTGEFTLTGPFHVNGATDVNGTLTVNGASTFVGDESHAGKLDYTGVETHYGNETHQGNITIQGNFDVTGGGRITAGVVFMDNSGTYGGRIGSTGATLELIAGTVVVTDLHANGMVFGHTSVESDNDVIAYGSLKSPNIGATTNSANVYVNGAGFLIEVTSARRFKKRIRVLPKSPGLLDVRMRHWQDKFDPEGPRVPGVIAEEVAEVDGGDIFVGREADGRAKSVFYDRLALATAHEVNRKLDAEVKALRAELAELRQLITK